jgi:hypothetical protein
MVQCLKDEGGKKTLWMSWYLDEASEKKEETAVLTLRLSGCTAV